MMFICFRRRLALWLLVLVPVTCPGRTVEHLLQETLTLRLTAAGVEAVVALLDADPEMAAGYQAQVAFVPAGGDGARLNLLRTSLQWQSGPSRLLPDRQGARLRLRIRGLQLRAGEVRLSRLFSEQPVPLLCREVVYGQARPEDLILEVPLEFLAGRDRIRVRVGSGATEMGARLEFAGGTCGAARPGLPPLRLQEPLRQAVDDWLVRVQRLLNRHLGRVLPEALALSVRLFPGEDPRWLELAVRPEHVRVVDGGLQVSGQSRLRTAGSFTGLQPSAGAVPLVEADLHPGLLSAVLTRLVEDRGRRPLDTAPWPVASELLDPSQLVAVLPDLQELDPGPEKIRAELEYDEAPRVYLSKTGAGLLFALPSLTLHLNLLRDGSWQPYFHLSLETVLDTDGGPAGFTARRLPGLRVRGRWDPVRTPVNPLFNEDLAVAVMTVTMRDLFGGRPLLRFGRPAGAAGGLGGAALQRRPPHLVLSLSRTPRLSRR